MVAPYTDTVWSIPVLYYIVLRYLISNKDTLCSMSVLYYTVLRYLFRYCTILY